MTTRREFIKILTGTVIAISLPMGLFGGESIIGDKNIEFTMTRIEIVSLLGDRDSGYYSYAIRCLAIPENKKLSPCVSAVGINDIDNYDKELFLEEMKYQIRQYYIDKLS